MKRARRDFRLIPVVLVAAISLFALKVSGLVLDGGYTLAERMQGLDKKNLLVTTQEKVPDYPKIVIADQRPAFAPTAPGKSWAQQMFNYGDSADITGSVGGGENASDPKLKVSDKPPDPPKLAVGTLTVQLADGHVNSAGERGILERLQERRKELDARSRELDMRENLLKAAEQRIDAKVAELKASEARINALLGNRDKAEAERFKNLVSMYENMKSKDAARILERLDLKILVEVATRIKPAKMSEILAQMTPEVAERLTVELAQRADPKMRAAEQLPKIEGKPQTP